MHTSLSGRLQSPVERHTVKRLTVKRLTALPCLRSLVAALLSLSRASRTLYCRSQHCPAGCRLRLSCCHCQGLRAHCTAAHSAALLAAICGCTAVSVKGSVHTSLPLTALPSLLSLAPALLSLTRATGMPHCRSQCCCACCHLRPRCCHCQQLRAAVTVNTSLPPTALLCLLSLAKGTVHIALQLTARLRSLVA